MQIFFWRYWIARLAICSPHVAQHGGKNTSLLQIASRRAPRKAQNQI
jgi:hypothetical protein